MDKPTKSNGKKTQKDLELEDSNEIKGGAPVKYFEVKLKEVLISG